MSGIGIPRAALNGNLAQVVNVHATPFPSRRQASRALPRELKHEHARATAFSPDRMGATLAIKAVIKTDHLVEVDDCLSDQGVGHFRGISLCSGGQRARLERQ